MQSNEIVVSFETPFAYEGAYDGYHNPMFVRNSTDSLNNTLSWDKLCSINFVRIRNVTDMIFNARQQIVAKFNPNVYGQISSAIENIRIASGTLFSTEKRFPEGEWKRFA